jgi:hypothetical protein
MRTRAVIIPAVAGLALAGCGGAKVVVPPHGFGPFTVTAPKTTTLANPQTGTWVRCTNHGVVAGAIVPGPGHGVSGSVDGKSASATLSLRRQNDGSLVLSCTP